MNLADENALFDLESVKLDSPRLTLIKAHDIQTHHAPHCEEPWTAIPMKAARVIADKYDPNSTHDTIPDICASIARILDERGMIFYGETQSEVEDAALAWVGTQGIEDAKEDETPTLL